MKAAVAFLLLTIWIELNAQSDDQRNVSEASVTGISQSVSLLPTTTSPTISLIYDTRTATEATTAYSVSTLPHTEAITQLSLPVTVPQNDTECDGNDDESENITAVDNDNQTSRSPPSESDRCGNRRVIHLQDEHSNVSLRMRRPMPLHLETTTTTSTSTSTASTTTKRKFMDCQCEGLWCKCCAHVSFPAISFEKDICETFTYDPADASLKIAIDIGGWVIYQDIMSALYPQPMCYSLPHTFSFARLCVNLTNVKITPTSISGCFRGFPKLPGVKLGEAKLGCWELGPFPVAYPVPTTSTTTPGTTTSPKPFDCNCQGYTCKCCVHLKWPKVSLDKYACVVFTYLPDDKAINMKFTMSGRVWFDKTLSALNPPPICLGLPMTFKFALMCIELYNGKIEDASYSGCFKAYAKLLGRPVAETKIGCFSIPLKTGK